MKAETCMAVVHNKATHSYNIEVKNTNYKNIKRAWFGKHKKGMSKLPMPALREAGEFSQSDAFGA